MAISQIGGSSAAGLQQYEQIFTTSGVWTKPAGVKTVEVTVVGGSCGATTSFYAGGAGGYTKKIVDVSGATTVPVTVGAAGTTSTNGGNSSFGDYASAGGSILNTGQMGPELLPGLGNIYVGTTTYSAPQALNVNKAGAYYWGFITSTNGTTIYRRSHPTTGSWEAVSLPVNLNYGYSRTTDRDSHYRMVYGNGLYAFIEYGQDRVFYSSDGTNWSTSTPGFYVRGIEYGNGKFVIHNNNSFKYSTNLTSWSNSTLGASVNSGFMTGIKYLNNLFVAVDQDAGYYQGWIWWSADGVTWNKITNQYIPTQNPGSCAPLVYSTRSNRFYGFMFYTNYSNSQNMLSNTLEFTINTTTNQAENWVDRGSASNYGYNTNLPAPVVFSDGNIYVAQSRYSAQSGIMKFDTVTKTWSNWLTYTASSDWPTTLFDDGTGKVYDYAGSTTNSLRLSEMLNGTTGEAGYNNGNNSLSAGAGGPWIVTAGSYGQFLPGAGTDEGWARGAYQNANPPAKSYGSGVWNGNNGRQGVVRVRWWA